MYTAKKLIDHVVGKTAFGSVFTDRVRLALTGANISAGRMTTYGLK